MTINLKEMSLSELRQLANRVERAIEGREKRKQKDALAAVEKTAREFGLSLEDVVGAAKTSKPGPKRPGRKPGRPKKKSAPKYRNPGDKSQTWTGKGRRPAWFIAAIDGGKSPDDMAI